MTRTLLERLDLINNNSQIFFTPEEIIDVLKEADQAIRKLTDALKKIESVFVSIDKTGEHLLGSELYDIRLLLTKYAPRRD